ncbi:DapH/DapD/GlmU-related protein [Neisseriaceae bacterium ESL0693]|nr:DapH/DapD/GlmU-related protein [Neisseriaceae bacterium ESL0693]
MMLLELIRSDLYRYAGRTDWFSFIRHYCFNPGFRFSFWLRLCATPHYWSKLAYPLYARQKRRSGILIHPSTSIGHGLYIGHGGPVIVNRSAIIGNNVNLSPYCVIGANHGTAAIIGDRVYIGPNCCIVEHVRIGEGATIGAGSVVTKDIPANATAAGNYAKVLNYHQPGRYIRNIWP